ncbi:hypothetical protein E4U41_007568 [Claviceps citrina]|nr:hypothetical protein E4U41_007568 [Claviceps citrina]
MPSASSPSKRTLAENGGVLIMGLPRSGTYSVAHAMRMLGHDRVFHNLDVPAEKSNEVWAGWFRAGWACMPYLREHMGLPYFARKKPAPKTTFTRADWDELVGNEYQVVADISACFAAELIEAYPEAQVVLWQRDFDSWFRSFDEGALRAFGFHSSTAMFVRKYVAPLSGMYWPTTQWYGHAGWLGARDYHGMRANARTVYDRHFEMVRKTTKPGKLLEYRLGDGWGPLCRFVACPVPDEPFPHLNERVALARAGSKMLRDVLWRAFWNAASIPVALLVVACLVASWASARPGQGSRP